MPMWIYTAITADPEARHHLAGKAETRPGPAPGFCCLLFTWLAHGDIVQLTDNKRRLNRLEGSKMARQWNKPNHWDDVVNTMMRDGKHRGLRELQEATKGFSGEKHNQFAKWIQEGAHLELIIALIGAAGWQGIAIDANGRIIPVRDDQHAHALGLGHVIAADRKHERDVNEKAKAKTQKRPIAARFNENELLAYLRVNDGFKGSLNALAMAAFKGGRVPGRTTVWALLKKLGDKINIEKHGPRGVSITIKETCPINAKKEFKATKNPHN